MSRRIVAAVLLAGLLFVGFHSIGPVPPIGPFLDPANGLWGTAAATNFPVLQDVAVAGIRSPVRVLVDDRGVPHIFAASEDDAFRALGYVEARDRLFQLEAQTRAASGRLTEWAGKSLLATDQESRSLALVWAADKKFASYDRSSPGFKAIVAYADGVNAYIDHMRPRDLPIEYRLLNARPMKWQPIYSLYFLSRMSLTLGFNDATVRRLKAQSMVGKAAADALFPVNSPIQQPIQPGVSSAPRYDFAALPDPGVPDSTSTVAAALEQSLEHAIAFRKPTESADAIGSNNWAVSPRRTAAGHALLAGDPHLELSLPSVWYEMHIVVPGRLDVAGVGFPGVPGVVIGFNRDVAWTFTNTGSDVNDYYAETVDDDAHPSRYKLDGEWKPLEKRAEKYLDPHGDVLATDTILLTERGPMRRQLGKWLSMRWTLYDNSHEPDNFLSLGYAKNATEWLDKMKDYVVPTQNGLVADRMGNIAIRSSGKYPVRPGDGRGDVIRDGSTSASDWKGQLPVEKYPFAMNPAQGFLASANQQPVDPRVNSSYMGSDWYSPWRAMRINALLRGDSAITPDKMRQFQTDPGSARADLFVPWFLSAAASRDSVSHDVTLREAAALLAKWDRRYVRESRQAILFEAAMAELASRTWDELRPTGARATAADRLNYPEAQLLAELMSTPRSSWWDDRATPARETRDEILAASLRSAFDSLRVAKGAVTADGWLWSSTRRANIHHLLRIPAFSALDIPVQGGPSTLGPSSGSGTQGPSWRMVVELGAEVRAWATYPGGQSGAPASVRYTDRLAKWTNGMLDQVLFPRTPDALDRKRVISTLTLTPQ